MRRRFDALVIGMVLVAGCSGEDLLSISILFPDEQAREVTQTVRVAVLLPAEDAGCQALQDGEVDPGDPGYPIETEMSVEKPATQSSDPLRVDGTGRRLFYAEGSTSDGTVVLRGCTEVQKTENGPREVEIQLAWFGEACDQNPDCDDGQYCNGDESCVDNMCRPGVRDCDDGDPCTLNECNEISDRCEHPPVPDPPEAEGPPGDATCSDGVDNDCDGLTDTGDPGCNACSQDADCDDSDDCTDDRCEGGTCVNETVLTSCDCGAPPQTMSLTCEDPVSLGAADSSTCTLQLSGGDSAGRADCLSCTADLGITVIDSADFGSGGACDLDGWTLVSGAPQTNCRSRADNCALGGGPQACCDDFATLCDPAWFGQPVLGSVFDTNCGGGIRQWVIQKTFDFGGHGDPWICFDLAGRQATDSSGILISAEDGQHPSEQFFCLNGHPQPEVDDFFYRHCASLPAWAGGSTDVTLTVVMHADASPEALFLDNFTVRAWTSGCGPSTTTLLDEGFDGCDTGRWAVTGSTTCSGAGCSNQPGWQPGLYGDGGPFAAETLLDASGADGELVACLRLGSDQPGGTDSVTLSYNPGTGFRTAWEQSGRLGPDGSCREVCVNLSDQDEAVLGNPALGLRIEVDSGGAIGLFAVTVTAAQYCSAGPGDIVIGMPPADSGGGAYDFSVTDARGEPLTTIVRCRFDPAAGVGARDTIRYLP